MKLKELLIIIKYKLNKIKKELTIFFLKWGYILMPQL